MPGQQGSASGNGPRSDRIYDTLRSRIASGELEPGDIVTELGLAAEFSVSRTPIREALKFLEWEGLLERRGRDMRVRLLDPEEVADIYSVRVVLEQLAAKQAASRRSDFDLAQLSSKLDAMRKLPARKVDQRAEAAYGFHFALWRAAHNATLIEALERLQAVVVSRPSTTLHYSKRWEELVEQCSEILEALTTGDADHAAKVIELQLVHARDAHLAIYTT